MRRTPCLLICSVLVLATMSWPRTAQAQIHRCTTEDGRPLYTDRSCESLGATERAPDPAPTPDTGPKSLGAAGTRLYRGGCSRTLQDLAYELRTAIDAQDANRLSGIYHWVGVSDGAAHAVMSRLETIVRRPLFDIAPILAEPPAESALFAGPAVPSHTTVRRPPTGLRLHQVQPNGITPVDTTLALQRHFGCWWITL